jgi:hypothetical protein
VSVSPYSKRAPVSTEILSSAYKTASLHSEPNDILLDASTCDYYGYVDNDGMMQIKCISNEKEALSTMTRLRWKYSNAAQACPIISIKPLLIHNA